MQDNAMLLFTSLKGETVDLLINTGQQHKHEYYYYYYYLDNSLPGDGPWCCGVFFGGGFPLVSPGGLTEEHDGQAM